MSVILTYEVKVTEKQWRLRVRVAFASAKLRKKFNTQRNLDKEYGYEQAKAISKRLQNFLSAHCLEDLRHAPGRYHELKGDLNGYFSVDLRGPYRLLFTPVEEGTELRGPDGEFDWEQITAVEIQGVYDTHE